MDVRALKDDANRLFVGGRFGRAAEIYRGLLEVLPNDPVLHLRLGRCNHRLGEVGAAIASYRSASRVLLDLGHRTRARAALKLALELSPHHPQIRQELEALAQRAHVRAATMEEALTAVVELGAADLPLEVDADLELDIEEDEPICEGALIREEAMVPEPSWILRIDVNTVALRRPDGRGWWLVRSEAPVQVDTFADGESAFPMPRPHLSIVA